MLEAGGLLQTWVLSELPHDWQDLKGLDIADSNSVAAEQLADHRLAYLDYEGPVSGDRGAVKRLDFGSYVTREQTPGRWLIDLAGQAIRGEIELQRTAGSASQWQLSFRPPAPLAV
jgi:hypothetical protein